MTLGPSRNRSGRETNRCGGAASALLFIAVASVSCEASAFSTSPSRFAPRFDGSLASSSSSSSSSSPPPPSSSSPSRRTASLDLEINMPTKISAAPMAEVAEWELIDASSEAETIGDRDGVRRPRLKRDGKEEEEEEEEVRDRGGGKKDRPPPSDSKYDWSFLDAVYLITCPNADPGSARLTKAMGVLSSLGLSDRVRVRKFDTDDEDRIRGCYTSHISVVREALRNVGKDERRRNLAESARGWWQEMIPSGREGNGANCANGDVNGEVRTAMEAKTWGRDIRVLVLEDNLDLGWGQLSQSTLDAVSSYTVSNDWDAFHLSYIPYVPDLLVTRTDDDSVVKLSCGVGSALGTTAYVISKSGMEALVREDDLRGYRDAVAIPDVMAELFPESRYAAYPAPFLRAPRTRSLVNPQLDDLRSALFQPAVVGTFQALLVGTGMKSNDIFFMMVGTLVGVAVLAGRVTVDAAWQMWMTGTYEGNAALPLLSAAFSVLALAVLGQGVALAPKPPPENSPVVNALETANRSCKLQSAGDKVR